MAACRSAGCCLIGKILCDRGGFARLALVVARILFDRLRRANDLAVGIVGLEVLRHAIEVDVGGDLHARFAGADDMGDDVLDLGAHARFMSRSPFVVGAGAMSACGSPLSLLDEQLALRVDDGDALRLQAFDGGGDEILDRLDLLAAQAGAFGVNDDGGRRLRRVAGEELALGDHEMHARRGHGLDRADGARKLALERAQAVEVLHEARGAESVLLVEELVAGAAARGQSLFGHRHAQAQHAVLGHEDEPAIALELVGHAHGFQPRDDGARVLDRERAEERRHGRLGQPQNDEGEKADEGRAYPGERRNARHAEAFSRNS